MLYLILFSAHMHSKLSSLTVNTQLILHTTVLRVKQTSLTQYYIITVFSVATLLLILDTLYSLFSITVTCLLFIAATHHHSS